MPIYPLLGLLVWLGTFGVQATEHKAGIELVIRPAICVLANNEALCRDELNVTWRAGTALSACLYRGASSGSPARCWYGETRGEVQFEVETATNIQFELRNTQDNSVLVKSELQVLREQQRFRERRRAVWSFF